MSGPFGLAALGAVLVGAGLACIAEATRRLKACEECDPDPVETIEAVATAGAEMMSEPDERRADADG